MKTLEFTIKNNLVTLIISDLRRLGVLHTLKLFCDCSSGDKSKLCKTVLNVALHEELTSWDITMLMLASCAVVDVLEASEIQDDKELATAYMMLNSFGNIKKELTTKED